ncbi:chemotaxis response regulator protein-glutamate methylesterase [Pseudoxanthobacter sp.]|uniref:chemotaxis response regulator protein-glutamate methylesterase n=1 Tax=Pseudoxanthobacter sp. TaxID=1925742 RepID=UPI002FE0CD35
MRIAIVNDSAMAVEALRRTLALEPRHSIAWVAANGLQAVESASRDRPDLVLMDLIMPVMDGVEATRRIMADSPCAILIVTVSREANLARVFEAMGHGALDVIETPMLGGDQAQNGIQSLLGKIATIERLVGVREALRPAPAAGPGPGEACPRLVVIGASAGGPAALASLVAALPRGLPAGIVIVQHVDERFVPGMVEWLGRVSPLPVEVAEDGMAILPGRIRMAGRSRHLVLTAEGRLAYVDEPRGGAYHPSIDVFFESVVQHWHGEVVGVLLTGMGSDGAVGLRSIRQAGNLTIAQDKDSSAVYGMPKAAVALGAVAEVLPLSGIAPRLVRILSGRDRVKCAANPGSGPAVTGAARKTQGSQDS